MSVLTVAKLIARGAISNKKLIAKYGKDAFQKAKQYLKLVSFYIFKMPHKGSYPNFMGQKIFSLLHLPWKRHS